MTNTRIYYIDQLIDWDITKEVKDYLGKTFWVPARPLSQTNPITRLKATWLVFTGQADAVIWDR